MIDTGSCDIHTILNGFKQGLASVESTWGVEEFITDIYYFFKKYPSRREDFEKVQTALMSEKLAVKRFVSNRWLSLGPVCLRIVEQWKCLRKYFLTDDHHKELSDTSAFRRICN